MPKTKPTNCLEGWVCPQCGWMEHFEIEVVLHRTIDVYVLYRTIDVYDSGTDDKGGDTEWTDTSKAECSDCNFSGIVLDFTGRNVTKLTRLKQLMTRRDALAETLRTTLDKAHMDAAFGVTDGMLELGRNYVAWARHEEMIRDFNST